MRSPSFSHICPTSRPTVGWRTVRAALSKSATVDGDCYGAIHAPTMLDSIVDEAALGAQCFRPCGLCLADSPHRDPLVVTPIAVLLHIGRPSNIVWLIMSIYVNAVETVLGGRLATYFSQKLIERLKAKFDAATAIATKCGVGWVITPTLSRAICSIFRSGMHPGSLSVSDVGRSNSFNIETSARSGMAVQQKRGLSNLPLATTALTEPIAARFTNAPKSDDPQSTKLTGSQYAEIVSDALHSGIIGYGSVEIRHKFLQFRNLCLGIRGRSNGSLCRI